MRELFVRVYSTGVTSRRVGVEEEWNHVGSLALRICKVAFHSLHSYSLVNGEKIQDLIVLSEQSVRQIFSPKPLHQTALRGVRGKIYAESIRYLSLAPGRLHRYILQHPSFVSSPR